MLISHTTRTAPSGFDQVQVVERGSRYILLSWDPPAASNGILVNYTVLQGSVAIATVESSILEYRVTDLLPFSDYTFSVRVCTAVGCVESPNITAMTLEDGAYTKHNQFSALTRLLGFFLWIDH